MTLNGGAMNAGTIYERTTSGNIATAYSFCSVPGCADGKQPTGGLVVALDGNLYGTTYAGGTTGSGTFFRFTRGGELKVLHTSCIVGECADGGGSEFSLIQGADGSLYGSTPYGVYNGGGTIFKIGGRNTAGPFQATNGLFYGVASFGGISDQACGGSRGVVFGLSTDLPPFLEALPATGRAGAEAKILATNLTGATSVTFHRVAAKFKVDAVSEITAIVPDGATTGKIQVINAKAILESDVPFVVP